VFGLVDPLHPGRYGASERRQAWLDEAGSAVLAWRHIDTCEMAEMPME
jgi:hypothetical protein